MQATAARAATVEMAGEMRLWSARTVANRTTCEKRKMICGVGRKRKIHSTEFNFVTFLQGVKLSQAQTFVAMDFNFSKPMVYKRTSMP